MSGFRAGFIVPIRWLKKRVVAKENKKVLEIINYVSPNHSKRRMPISAILLHHTGGLMPGCRNWLCMTESKVSAHYIVTIGGLVYQLVEDHRRAWHAGRGAFDLDRDGQISRAEKMWNDISIGIELEAVSSSEYSDKQMESLDMLIYNKCWEHKIRPANIIGHLEIAPTRKIDPANFNLAGYRNKMKKLLS